TKTLGVAFGQVAGDHPADAAADENRVIELERIGQADHEAGGEVRREELILGEEIAVVGWVGLAVGREVVGDYAVLLGQLAVFEQVPPLPVLVAGGMLAQDRDAFAGLEIEHLVATAID